MSRSTERDEYDLNRLVLKPLYAGLTINILLPMAVLLACYFLQQRQSLYNRIGDSADILFYVLCALSFGHALVAVIWRYKKFNVPLVRSEESFEDDLADALAKRSRPVFLLLASITVYGAIYFFLTARFKETVFLALFSFLVFQVIRPRYGFVRRLIEKQKQLVKEGRFLREG